MANANLFQQYLQPVKSVQDYSNEMAQSEGNQLELAAKRQGLQDDAATRAAFQASGGDQANALQRLMQGGQYKAAQSLQKSMIDAQKAQSDIGLATSHAKNFDSTSKKTDQEVKFAAGVDHARSLSYVKSPEDMISYFDQGIAKGIFPAEQRDQMIAQADKYPTIDAWKDAELKASIPVLDKFKIDAENSRNAATNTTSRENNQATVGATLAGQQSTAATAAAGRAQADRHFKESQTADNKSVTYQTDANGNLVALPSKVAPGAGISALPVIGENGKPMQGKNTMPVEFNKSVTGLKELTNALGSYEQTLKDNGGASPLAVGARRGNLQGSYTALQMGLKNAFELGALAGPDLSLLQGMLVDPTSARGMALGDKGIAAQIEKVKEYIKNRGSAVYEAHKQPIPLEFSRSGGASGDFGSSKGGFKYLGSE